MNQREWVETALLMFIVFVLVAVLLTVVLPHVAGGG